MDLEESEGEVERIRSARVKEAFLLLLNQVVFGASTVSPAISEFLRQVDPVTGVSNSALVASCYSDLALPDKEGRVVLEAVRPLGNFVAKADDMIFLDRVTPEGSEYSKPAAVIVLNQSSSEWSEVVLARGGLLSGPKTILQLDEVATLEVLQQVVANQIALEADPEEHMTRLEYKVRKARVLRS